MKRNLQALRDAGIRLARFSARVDARGKTGAIGLRHVISPTGITGHAWVNADEWHGQIPQKWDEVEFTASIRTYYKGNGVEDVGLFDVWVME